MKVWWTIPELSRILLAQFISVTGSYVAGFALPIWLFQQHGTATSVTYVTLAAFLPRVLCAPLVGTLVDWYPKRTILLVSEVAQAVAAGSLLLLIWWGDAPLWSLCAVQFLSGIFNTVQFPCIAAITAAVTPGNVLTRVNGALSTVESVAQLLAPLLASALLQQYSIAIVLVVDAATFCVAAALLWAVPYIPGPTVIRTWRMFMTECSAGWRALRTLHGLRHLLWLNSGINFMFSLSFALLTPMVLTIRPGAIWIVSAIMTIGGVAHLVGGIAMSCWAGPRNRVYSELYGTVIMGCCGALVIGLASDPVGWALGYAVTMAILPYVNTLNRSVWQMSTPASLHGRLFALKRMFSSIWAPLGFAVAGPLVDRLLEPNFAPPVGDGYRVAFIVAGSIIVILGGIGFFSAAIRTLNRDTRNEKRATMIAEEASCHMR